jgi:hypothetical protein
MPRCLVNPILKVAVVTALVAAALVGTAARPTPAQAATPCWKLLLNDWYDGRIDQTYPVHCYREALKHLPSDVQTYSSAHDDILRALQSAIAKQQTEHKPVGGNTPVPPQSGGSSGGSGDGSGDGGTTDTGPNNTDAGGGTTTTSEPGRDSGGGLAGQVSSDSPSSIPTPLLVLGGLALILVAAGGAGLIAKRVQSRRQAP